MAKDPAFPFYAQDFMSGVMHLTMAERGVYITLLAYQWSHFKIPKKRLGLIVNLIWEDMSEELKEKFVEDGDFFFNQRLESEREKRKIFKEKQSKNGKKGGRPRIDKNPNKTQTKSQKKPLEDENENESDNESKSDNEKKGKPVFPFDSKNFKAQWDHWKIYKKTEFKFNYKSLQSEQAALNSLSKLANDEKTAIEIIHQSMSNGWKGFFEYKSNNNEKTDAISRAQQVDQAVDDLLG